MLKKLINIDLSTNQLHVINIIASVTNLAVTTLISFFLSPYIVRTIGVEANGFINLANNFIMYMMLASTALNSMGSRFMIIAFYNNEYKKFNQYYSSLFIADIILAVLLSIISGFCIWKLEYILDIPKNIIVDVKLLFLLLFSNFIITTAITVWNTSIYVRNKLFLDSTTTALSSIIRVVVIFCLFFFLPPSVYYVGLGTLVGAGVGYILRFLYKKTLFPDLRVNMKYFSVKSVWELLSSGIWNTLSNLGTILTDGLDLLITNLFIGSTLMGSLSLAKTMPGFVNTLIAAIASVFAPTLIKEYAVENTGGIIRTLKQSTKITSAICSIPLGFLLVYGKEFFSLWQPTQDAKMLYTLSTISIFGRVFFVGMDPLVQIFTVTNKVKQNALVTVINGLISVLTTFLFVKFTNLGVYAVAGVSVVCCFIKNVLFVYPYSAKYLGLKKTSFFVTMGYSLLCCTMLVIIGCCLKTFLLGTTWFKLIIAAVVFSIIGFAANSVIVLNKEERKILISKVLRK